MAATPAPQATPLPWLGWLKAAGLSFAVAAVSAGTSLYLLASA